MAKNSKKHSKKANNKKAAAANKAKQSKANAEKTAQPGVISEIMACLNKAKEAKAPVTSGEILQHLAKKFPNREVTGMMITVRAQLSRLPKEKEFDIAKLRDGRIVRYAAA